jgi:hypothetical protein
VGYQRQVPTVTGNITVLDTDIELVSMFSSGSLNSLDTEFQPGIDEPVAASGIELQVQLVDPGDSVEPLTVLKTVLVPQLVIEGDAFTQNVNENAQQVWNWRSFTAECIVYSGEP